MGFGWAQPKEVTQDPISMDSTSAGGVKGVGWSVYWVAAKDRGLGSPGC